MQFSEQFHKIHPADATHTIAVRRHTPTLAFFAGTHTQCCAQQHAAAAVLDPATHTLSGVPIQPSRNAPPWQLQGVLEVCPYTGPPKVTPMAPTTTSPHHRQQQQQGCTGHADAAHGAAAGRHKGNPQMLALASALTRQGKCTLHSRHQPNEAKNGLEPSKTVFKPDSSR